MPKSIRMSINDFDNVDDESQFFNFYFEWVTFPATAPKD